MLSLANYFFLVLLFLTFFSGSVASAAEYKVIEAFMQAYVLGGCRFYEGGCVMSEFKCT